MPGIKEWVAKASSDLKSAKLLITDDETIDNAAYFTQQSAEKILKAYLVCKQQPIPRTHDLEKILDICIVFDTSFNQLEEDVELLAPYATYARYPDDRFNIDRNEAENAIKHAEKIFKFVKTKIDQSKPSPQMKMF